MLMEKKENDMFIFPRVAKWFCFLLQLGMNERRRKMRIFLFGTQYKDKITYSEYNIIALPPAPVLDCNRWRNYHKYTRSCMDRQRIMYIKTNYIVRRLLILQPHHIEQHHITTHVPHAKSLVLSPFFQSRLRSLIKKNRMLQTSSTTSCQ